MHSDSGTIADLTGRSDELPEYEPTGEPLLRSREDSAAVLVGGIAHDLNNIIMVIAGAAHLIQLLQNSDDAPQRFIHTIIDASDRAASLVRELLSFSRTRTLKPCWTDLNEVVDKSRDFLGHLHDESVALDISFADQALPIFADMYQIEQVLMNLVANAYDALPCGGRISIATRLSREGEIPDLVPGRHAVLTVTDNGIGMDAETLKNAFEPYFTNKNNGSGTGLGLALVRSIVEQHRGSITISSEPGRGTTVVICLPTGQV
jgi:Signal transduction histidine kinase